jgi:hypothetical protein
MLFGHTHAFISSPRARLAQRESFQPSAFTSQVSAFWGAYTLAQLVAENNGVGFEMLEIDAVGSAGKRGWRPAVGGAYGVADPRTARGELRAESCQTFAGKNAIDLGIAR